MATNPMQRKSRNSFILGMLVMLIISGAIIALLFMQLTKLAKIEKERDESYSTAYALKEDVKSGQIITKDMLEPIKVDKTLVPSNAVGDLTIIENYALQDKEGNAITTKASKGKDGETVLTMNIKRDNRDYEVKEEETTGSLYIEKNNDKEYLELTEVPLIAKVDMKKNTLITREFLSKRDSMVQDDVRKQEYNVVVMPADLATGDYVDIRILFPNGQDFIVVAKKEIEIPQINGVDSEDTMWMNLTEDEILHMSCAIIDAASIRGSRIYANKYTEAGMQAAAVPTYPANESTLSLLQSDPNIVERAMNTIKSRYGAANSANIRMQYVKPLLDAEGEQAKSNRETSIEESTTKSKSVRKQYLDSLAGVVTE